MKSPSPRNLSFLISLIISSVILIVSVFALLFTPEREWIILVITLLISFSVSYITVYYAMNNYLYGKIEPIYKTIENITVTSRELRKKLEGKDVIQEVHSLVINYARSRAKEIKKLRRLENYRKEFLGNVSHELKTPIFNIQGYILTLLEGGLEDPEINREYLVRTEKSINRMIAIIHDLESISRLESGELELEIQNFDIVQLIKDVFQQQERNTKKYDIDLAFKKNYDKPIIVAGDKKQISEVVNNLVQNSIIYGKKGGATVVSIEELADNILVSITDNGVGIAQEDIPRIFERFFRTDAGRSRDRGGTGLGLSIVKHIIEAHNQTITVSSAVGKGSVFSFTLKKS